MKSIYTNSKFPRDSKVILGLYFQILNLLLISKPTFSSGTLNRSQSICEFVDFTNQQWSKPVNGYDGYLVASFVPQFTFDCARLLLNLLLYLHSNSQVAPWSDRAYSFSSYATFFFFSSIGICILVPLCCQNFQKFYAHKMTRHNFTCVLIIISSVYQFLSSNFARIVS